MGSVRTTINIDENLLAHARKLALHKKCSLGEVVDDALRESFHRSQQRQGTPRSRTRLPTFRGQGVQPGVDLTSASRLLDVMEGR